MGTLTTRWDQNRLTTYLQLIKMSNKKSILTFQIIYKSPINFFTYFQRYVTQIYIF